MIDIGDPWFPDARWLKREIAFASINYKVIRIRGKYMLAHGTENKMPHWEVRTSLPYSCEELLLGLRPYCCGQLHRPYCCEELYVWSLLK